MELALHAATQQLEYVENSRDAIQAELEVLKDIGNSDVIATKAEMGRLRENVQVILTL